ncbi:MAG: GNAT family N-acetyltransferase [Planctomycetota bacterium]
MASLTGPPIPPASPAPDPSVRFERIGERLRRDALSVLLTGRRDPSEAAVRPFLAFAEQNQLDLTGLWVAWDGKRMAAATLIVPGVGKTAMLFLSPVASGGRVTLSGQLVARAVADIDASVICLVQSLLEHGQTLQQRAIEAGGFRFLSELAYMQRPGKAFAPLPPVVLDGETLSPVHWSEAHRPVFAEAISESYQDTQDCPGLLGLREMDDIIAGHMATGRFDPSHWTVWRDGVGRPAAVLLLAESTGNGGFELVYLGVSPHARGRGLSKVLMRYALDLTDKHGRGDLFLAVDDRNEPALRLYRGLGFRVSVRKTALIYTPE